MLYISARWTVFNVISSTNVLQNSTPIYWLHIYRTHIISHLTLPNSSPYMSLPMKNWSQRIRPVTEIQALFLVMRETVAQIKMKRRSVMVHVVSRRRRTAGLRCSGNWRRTQAPRRSWRAKRSEGAICVLVCGLSRSPSVMVRRWRGESVVQRNPLWISMGSWSSSLGCWRRVLVMRQLLLLHLLLEQSGNERKICHFLGE